MKKQLTIHSIVSSYLTELKNSRQIDIDYICRLVNIEVFHLFGNNPNIPNGNIPTEAKYGLTKEQSVEVEEQLKNIRKKELLLKLKECFKKISISKGDPRKTEIFKKEKDEITDRLIKLGVTNDEISIFLSLKQEDIIKIVRKEVDNILNYL